jgi:hypothetical protein
MHANKCAATNLNGAACRAVPLPDSAYCFNHDPDLAERRAENRRKGGRARSNAARAAKQFSDTPLTTAELLGTLSRAVRRTEAGDMEPNIANALAGLCRAISSIRENAELEERIAALEQSSGTNVTRLHDRRSA